jgi:hypothetical protein
MFKINNKKINSIMVYSLGILVILTFGLTMPAEVNADRAGYVTPYNSTRFPNVQSNDQYNSYVGPSATPIVYSASPAVVRTTTVVKKTTPAIKSSGAVLGKEDSSNLVANAVYGSNSFMPSGILQWILFAILVLLIVILVRKIFGGAKDYHSTPMKHA